MTQVQDDDKLRLKMPKDIFEAHAHSINNRFQVLASHLCGCFFCEITFKPNKVKEWVMTGNNDEFAACPRCGFDSVIGDASGFPITKAFLHLMNIHWSAT